MAVYQGTSRKSPGFKYWKYERVENQLRLMTIDECRAEFRVDLADLSDTFITKLCLSLGLNF